MVKVYTLKSGIEEFLCSTTTTDNALEIVNKELERCGINVPYYRFNFNGKNELEIDYGSHINFFLLRGNIELHP